MSFWCTHRKPGKCLALSSLHLCVSPKHGKWHFGAKKVLGYLQKCLAKIHLKSASKKLWVFFWCKQYFNSAQLFKLHTSFIHPCLEYCSRIWGSSPYTSLLNRVESKAIRLIRDPSLTLTLRSKVASLSLFYCYYFGHCSDELAACIPPPMAQPRSTRQATFAHNY